MFRTFLFMLSFAALGLMSIIVPAQAAQSVKALSPTMQSKVKAFKRNAPPAAIRNLAPTTKESATGSGIRRVDIHYTAEGATSEPLIQVPESLLRPVGQVGSAHSDLNIVGSIHMGGLSYMTVDPELDAAVNKIIGNAPTGCVVLDPMHKQQTPNGQDRYFWRQLQFMDTANKPACWAYFKGLSQVDLSASRAVESHKVNGHWVRSYPNLTDGQNRTGTVGPVTPW